jgi:hypothetical protein
VALFLIAGVQKDRYKRKDGTDAEFVRLHVVHGRLPGPLAGKFAGLPVRELVTSFALAEQVSKDVMGVFDIDIGVCRMFGEDRASADAFRFLGPISDFVFSDGCLVQRRQSIAEPPKSSSKAA